MREDSDDDFGDVLDDIAIGTLVVLPLLLPFLLVIYIVAAIVKSVRRESEEKRFWDSMEEANRTIRSHEIETYGYSNRPEKVDRENAFQSHEPARFGGKHG